MNTRLEIILEVNGVRYYLDTTAIEAIPLTFNIADIKDISQTKGSFSKSIVIPETKNNREIFNNITDLNSQSNFNPNIRNRAYILLDSEMIIEGFFQLTNVGLGFGEDKNNMTLVIYTDNNDFYTILGEEYIETLNLSRFDHIWSKNNIVYSWTQSFSHGYFYPLIDYGYDWDIKDMNGTNNVPSVPKSGIVKVSDMYPAIYARTIWDQIFTEAGFAWNSQSLISETPFNQLIIPFNGKEMAVSNTYVQDRTFKATLTTAVPVILRYNYVYLRNYISSCYLPPYVSPAYWNAGNPNNFFEDPFDPLAYDILPTGTITTTATYSFNNDTISPGDDPNGLWNTTLFVYTNTSSAPVTQRFGFNLKIKQLNYYSDNNVPFVQLYRSRNPTTGATVSGGFRVNTCDTYLSTNGEYRISTAFGWQKTQGSPWGMAGNPCGSGDITMYEKFEAQFYALPFQIFPGEKVWLTYTFPIAGQGGFDIQTDNYDYYNNVGDSIMILLRGKTLAELEPDSTIFNEVSAAYSVNELIEFNSCIPKKIKKRDFVLSIIKMFNLIVEPSKVYPNTLNIETRDYYYRTGQIKDWSQKVDLNDEIEVKVLGDTQNKRTRLKYKDDKDFYNADYTLKTGDTYGEYRYVIENEFCDGEKKVEVIFSPTPNVSVLEDSNVIGPTASAMIIPKIGVINNNQFAYVASNIRILQKNLLSLPLGARWKLENINDPFITVYPYSGHMDNPYNPTFDINFGQTEGLYYPQTTTTNNNLFTRFWKRMMDEIADRDSRIITCSMYLTAFDIINFRFNDSIFLDFGQGGQYYKVNKIENYDPSKISTCKVELIRTKDITVPRPAIKISRPKGDVKPFITTIGPVRGNVIKNPRVLVLGEGNNISNSGVVVGYGNNVSGKDSVITGNDNTILSSSTFVKGSGNIVDGNSTKIFITGDNNSITGATNVKLMGDNNTIVPTIGATQSPTDIISFGNDMTISNSNSFNISGILVVNNNYISAGSDEILGRFADNSIINYISGSRDEVRDFGTQVNISLISGARDTII